MDEGLFETAERDESLWTGFGIIPAQFPRSIKVQEQVSAFQGEPGPGDHRPFDPWMSGVRYQTQYNLYIVQLDRPIKVENL
jgi:hypothetical protein